MKKLLVVSAVVLLCASAADASETSAVPRIADEHCALRFEKGGLIVSDASGFDMMTIGRIPFVWNAACAVPKTASLRDGKIEIDYEIQNAGTNDIRMTSVASLTGHGFRLDATAQIPPNVKSGGQMIEIVLKKGATKDNRAISKCGYWRRCKPAEWKDFYRAGDPFEVRSAYMKPYRTPTQTFWCLNTGWSGARTEAMGFPRQAKDGVFRGRIEFLTGVNSENAQVAAAGKDGRPFVMAFTTEKPFNIFEKGSPVVTLTVSPLVTGTRTLTFWAKDFDGVTVAEEKKEMTVEKGKAAVFSWTLPAFDGGRGIYFLEASITNAAGEEECFSRTNVAVLPPHEFKHRDTSVAAMAAYPSTEDAYRLMERLGVAIVRYGDNTILNKYGITAYGSKFAPGHILDASNPKDLKFLDEQIIAQIEKWKVPYLEFGNEVGWKKPPEVQDQLVKAYKSWLVAIRNRMKEKGLDAKLISFGLQPDYTVSMMERMKKEGIFDLLDGLTLHPGRGFYPADEVHGGWVYRGIIQRARKKFTEMGYGDKEIHITECYAATCPNSSWVDSYRKATENTLLNLVVATVEPRVKNAMFYKLHQGTSQDPNGYPFAAPSGVTITFGEYDFGLLMRDNSPKPSLLAYAAACEQLDGAKFVRELQRVRGGTSLRAFEFTTPRGPLAVIYDRVQGGNYFELWRKECPRGVPKGLNLYRNREAWERHWTKRVPRTFKARAKEVTVIDVIGRARMIRPDEKGEVTLDLDGEPVMVYGLDLNPIFAKHGTVKQTKDEASAPVDYDYAAEEQSAVE